MLEPLKLKQLLNVYLIRKKSRILETPNLSTDANSSTNILVSTGIKTGADSQKIFFFLYPPPPPLPSLSSPPPSSPPPPPPKGLLKKKSPPPQSGDSGEKGNMRCAGTSKM